MIFRTLISFYLLVIIVNLEGLTGANTNPIEKGLLLICSLVFVMTRRIYVANIGLALALVAATVISAVGTQYSGFGLDRYFRGLISLVTPFLLLCAEPTEKDSKRLLLIFAWAPLVAMVLGVMYQVAGIRAIWYTDFLTATRLQGSLSPAGLGSLCYLGAIAATLKAAADRRRLYIWLGLAAVNCVILVLSAARMPLALTVLVCAVIYLTMVNPNVSGMLTAALAGIPAAAVVMLVFGQSLLARFESESLSGRELLWQYLEIALADHPVFGVGIGHQILLLPERLKTLTTTMAAHNEYLRIAVETGYVGAVIIFGAIALMCLNICRLSRVSHRFAFLAICVSFFIFCKTDNAISSSITPFALVLASFAFPRGRKQHHTDPAAYRMPESYGATAARSRLQGHGHTGLPLKRFH